MEDTGSRMIRIEGVSKLTLTEEFREGDDLAIYKGTVQVGNYFKARPQNALVLAYTLEEAQAQLSCGISHPMLMDILAFGRGMNNFSNYCFIAYHKFDCRLSQFVLDKDPVDGHNKRLMPWFQHILQDVTKAICALHERNYHLGEKLDPKDIFMCASGESSHYARLARFRPLPSELTEIEKQQKKDNDWKLFGIFIKQLVGKNHEHDSENFVEIRDLCEKLQDGSLHSYDDIHEHPAMWSAHEKQFYLMALNNAIRSSSSPVILERSDIIGLELWSQSVPRYIDMDKIYEEDESLRQLKDIIKLNDYDDTISDFVRFLRNLLIYEHTFREALAERSIDMECCIRDVWPRVFLNLQKNAPRRSVKHYL